MVPLVTTSLVVLLPPLGLIAWSIWDRWRRERRYRRAVGGLRQLAAHAGSGEAVPPFPSRGALSHWLNLTASLAAQAEDPQGLVELLEILAPELATPLRWHTQYGLHHLFTTAHNTRKALRSRQLRGHLLLVREAPNSNLLPYLVGCLLDPDPAVAGAATMAVGHNPSFYPGAAVATATALRDGTSQTIHAHSWNLGQLLETHPELLRVLESDPSERVRRVVAGTVVRLLERYQELHSGANLRDSLRPRVEAATQDPDPTVRCLAFAALRFLSSVRRRALAEAALHDPVQEVRLKAVEALAAAGDDGALARLVDELPQAAPALQRGILTALEGVAAEVPAAVWAGTHQGSPAARRWAIEAVGALGGAEVVPGLVALLGDERADLRAAAARALGTLALKRQALPALRKAVFTISERCRHEEDPHVLVALADTLASTGDEAADNAILARLAVAPDAVRERLLEILARCEQGARPSAAGDRRGAESLDETAIGRD
ncbi:MAG: hypothetical protein GY856_45560 [bacterium]|nr:hypothetical protein [bacterium]